MGNKVYDLDTLRPAKKLVRLGGKEIDVSYIPTAITWEVDNVVRELEKINLEKMQEGGDETKKAFDLTIDLCVLFCEWKYPELDRQWFLENTGPQQINAFAEIIKQTLEDAYKGAEAYQKNLTAAQGTETSTSAASS